MKPCTSWPSCKKGEKKGQGKVCTRTTYAFEKSALHFPYLVSLNLLSKVPKESWWVVLLTPFTKPEIVWVSTVWQVNISDKCLSLCTAADCKTEKIYILSLAHRLHHSSSFLKHWYQSNQKDLPKYFRFVENVSCLNTSAFTLIHVARIP